MTTHTEILEILKDLREEISRQENILNLTDDDDLIESLNCRYNHYLKLAKKSAS